MAWEGYAIIIRHGVTDWDSATRGPRIEGEKQPSDRVTGWLDLPLRHEGLQEVLRTSDALKGFPIELIMTSPLSRCVVTAQAVQRLHPQVPIQKDPALRAWNTGIYSGQLATKVQKTLDEAVAKPDTPIPLGETFSEFVRRFLPSALAYIQDPRLVAIVTHGMNVEVIEHYERTGSVTFTHYTGINAGIEPGEAMYITPFGLKELVA